jgi:hypothetical protein
LKFTQYFLHTRNRPDRKNIRIEWIQETLNSAEHEEIQTDGRIRRWKQIEEADNKYLRIVLLKDGETVHNAFFDRSFKGEK